MQDRMVITFVSLAVLLLAVGGADYFLKEGPHYRDVLAQQQEMANQITAASGVKKGVSTRKEINVDELLATQGFIAQSTQELSLLKLTSPADVDVKTTVLLKNNDRAALFAWLESPDVKDIFANLKQSLQQSFSKDVKNLLDETGQADGGPIINTLSFTDPAISPEQVIFLRVRTRLYELHVAKGFEPALRTLTDALSK